MPHPEIVKLVYAEIEKMTDKPGWWAQGITVAYEQHIGRRAAGQRSDGTFEVSVSRTFNGSREEVFTKCLERLTNETEFDGRSIANVRTSKTLVRSYWRCDLDDGSKLTIAIEQKAPGKVLIVVTHSSLQSADEGSNWREFWKSYTEEL